MVSMKHVCQTTRRESKRDDNDAVSPGAMGAVPGVDMHSAPVLGDVVGFA